jgi:hypothetical protein
MRSSATPPGPVMTAIGLPRYVTTMRSPALALGRYSLSRFLICLIPTVIIEASYMATISYFVDTFHAPTSAETYFDRARIACALGMASKARDEQVHLLLGSYSRGYGQTVVVDLNHPLARKTLNFDVKITVIKGAEAR